MLRQLRLTAESEIILGSFAIYTLLLWAVPILALSVSVAILLGTILLALARVACAAAATPQHLGTQTVEDEFVSIHIATHSEPADVVIATLDSLAHLTHPHYEVIVVDNNTPDPALYEPVRQHCEKLGEKFRFYHFDGVEGAKAGALNISLDLADPRTEVVLILDADYQARPGILEAGLTHFVDSGVALVQFPQAYRNSDLGCGLTWDYKLFFDVYMNLANRYNTVLSTGTAAFVRKHALKTLGGWSGDTLTEDAELGLRFHRIGYRGVYVPEVVAAGVMPTDLSALRVQRRRWILGNAQSLVQLWKEPKINVARKALMSLQLSAWASPLLLSALTFLSAAFVATLTGSFIAQTILSLSSLAILWYLVGTMGFFAIAVTRQGQSLAVAFRAMMAHLGTQWEASLAWCELFVSSDKSFQRTSKSIRAPEMVALAMTAGLSLVCCGIGLDLLRGGGSPWLAFACSLSSVLFSGIAYLRWNLHTIRQRTVELAEGSSGDLLPLGERMVPARPASVPSPLLDKKILAGKRILQEWSTSNN